MLRLKVSGVTSDCRVTAAVFTEEREYSNVQRYKWLLQYPESQVTTAVYRDTSDCSSIQRDK